MTGPAGNEAKRGTAPAAGATPRATAGFALENGKDRRMTAKRTRPKPEAKARSTAQAAGATKGWAASGPDTKPHRIFSVAVASVYPYYVAKAERKGRSQAEVDRIIRWLTGYTQRGLESRLAKKTDFATFFAEAPKSHPLRALVTGTICGIRVESIADPLLREIRILDKLVDELAKGRPMEKILRTPAEE